MVDASDAQAGVEVSSSDVDPVVGRGTHGDRSCCWTSTLMRSLQCSSQVLSAVTEQT